MATTLINAGTLKGLLRLIPRGIVDVAYRPGLFGVTFEPDGLVMATNGHSLLVFKSGRTFDGDAFVVNADTLRALIKGQKPRATVAIVRPEQPIAPPNWRRAVPAEYSDDPGDNALNPELVLDVRDAVNDIQEAEGLALPRAQVNVLPVVPNGNAVWLVYATDRLLGIVMPLRRSQDAEDRAQRCAAEFLAPAVDPLS